MSGYPNERDCEHGHLRRKCPLCEAYAEIKELQSRLDECRESCARAVAARDVAVAKLDTAVQERDAALLRLDQIREKLEAEPRYTRPNDYEQGRDDLAGEVLTMLRAVETSLPVDGQAVDYCAKCAGYFNLPHVCE